MTLMLGVNDPKLFLFVADAKLSVLRLVWHLGARHH
jgi:hypothetical protein